MPGQPLLSRPGPDDYEGLARDLVDAYESGDSSALQRLNEHYRRAFTREDVRAEVWRRVYKVRRAKARPGCFQLGDAQLFIAREAGFGNWEALLRAAATGAPPPGEAYAIDTKEDRIAPRRHLTEQDWDRLIAVMKEQRIAALDANGEMTDSVMERVAALEHVTRLSLGGSRQLTDDGLRHLARMPQLEELDLSEYPGGVLTDRGLAVLRHLPALRRFQMCWQSAITDAGVAHLACCERLERVNLLGTPTGDGALRALAGKRHLRRFNTGRLVTDAGLPLLQEFPLFKTWQGGEPQYGLMSFESGPTHLLLDGPFTGQGLKMLAGLDGLFSLGFFWHTSALTGRELKPLTEFAHLGFLGCQGELCNDEAMRHVAAIPRLRMLMGQGAVATDEGFEVLSRCPTLEYFWGRECPNLSGRGFAALSRMPSLRGLAVSCKNVEDASLALLPRFPALRQLMPMDVTDAGFRHVGACHQLENLWCMYCRDTTDTATEHLGRLSKLKSYYAGSTQITDRSLEILGHLLSLEKIEFNECTGVSDAGLVFLAGLPRLREITLSGLPQVTLDGTKVFRTGVRVEYSV